VTLLSTEESQQERVPPREAFYTINLLLEAGLIKISLFNILLHEIHRLLLPVMYEKKISSTQVKRVLIHREIWIIKCGIIKISLDG